MTPSLRRERPATRVGKWEWETRIGEHYSAWKEGGLLRPAAWGDLKTLDVKEADTSHLLCGPISVDVQSKCIRGNRRQTSGCLRPVEMEGLGRGGR